MTVRELVNELTASYIKWDAEVYVSVASQLIKDGEGMIWENHSIDRCSLHSPTWYIGDRCHLVIGCEKE